MVDSEVEESSHLKIVIMIALVNQGFGQPPSIFTAYRCMLDF